MRNLIFAFMLLSIAAGAQEPANYKSVSPIVMKAYNEKDYAALYNTFNESMASFMPVDKLQFVFGAMKQSWGQMQSLQFEKMSAGIALYKATFQNATLQAKLALDQDNKVAGLQFVDYSIPKAYTVIQRNTTKLSLPFKEEWYTFWGGDNLEQNYHVESRSQKDAFDFLIMDAGGSTHTGDGTKNEDYYAFGKEILAPCDAVVTDVVDGVRDNVPGEMNKMFIPGNMVMLKTDNNEHLFFAHFKQHSIKLKPGDKVKKGDVLGLCGNSGHSSEPHLHFHIQNTYDTDNATGAKCYFEKLTLKNGSGEQVVTDYSPVKGDRIKK